MDAKGDLFNLIPIFTNEETDKWDYRGGTIDEIQRLVWQDVSHFSTYGVFVDEKGPEVTQFDITNITNDSVMLNVEAHDPSGIAQIAVYRNGELIAILDDGSTTFIDFGLQSETEYEYVLKITDQFGNETVSDANVIKTLAQYLDENKLPTTATNIYTWLLIGLKVLVLGSVAHFNRKRKSMIEM